MRYSLALGIKQDHFFDNHDNLHVFYDLADTDLRVLTLLQQLNLNAKDGNRLQLFENRRSSKSLCVFRNRVESQPMLMSRIVLVDRLLAVGAYEVGLLAKDAKGAYDNIYEELSFFFSWFVLIFFSFSDSFSRFVFDFL